MALPPCRRSDVHITKHRNHPKEHAMSTSRFIQRFGDKITGVLGGFDRLVLRGSLLAIVPVEGMKRVLWLKNILLKDFGRWAERMTAQLRSVFESGSGSATAYRVFAIRQHRQGGGRAQDRH